VDAASIKVAGKPVVDSTGQIAPGAGAAFAEKAALASAGAVNDASNPVDWTKLKNVPGHLLNPGLSSVAHDGSLDGAGTAQKPLRVVFGTTAGTVAAGDHVHPDHALGADLSGYQKLLRSPGTLNAAANPVDWTTLKAVPPGLADGVDDGLTSVSVSPPLLGNGNPSNPVSLTPASGSSSGFLSASDWTRFDAKLSSIAAGAPLAGLGTAASPLSLPPASATADGYLSRTDWASFNGKMGPLTANFPLLGAGTSSSPLSIRIASATDDGYLAKTDWAYFNAKLGSVTAGGPLSGSGTAAAPLKIGPASVAADGYLSKGDFATFNNKLSGVLVTAPLAGTGAPTSPLLLAKATSTSDGFLSAADFAVFNEKLGGVTASGPLSGSGTAGSPLSIAKATASASGYLAAADFAAFSGKVSSVAAGTGISTGGTPTAPTISVVYGAAAGTAAEGNDPRLSDPRAPTSGSSSYIQNQSAGAQSASFNINGGAVIGGSVGIGTAAPQAKLEVNAPTRTKDAVAFHVYSTGSSIGHRLVAKWTGGSDRKYKFWVDDSFGADTAWNLFFRDGDVTGVWTQWQSQTGGPLWGLGASESAALLTPNDGGMLYFNRDTSLLILSNCANCTAILAYEYNNVIPLVAGDFIRAVDAKVQGQPNAITQNVSGNVGIGTVSPGDKLHIYGRAHLQLRRE
jgi:hypothetical protein